jgi:para-aminobenzoate synthetase component I
MKDVEIIEKELDYADSVKGFWGLSQLPFFTLFKADGGRYDVATALPSQCLRDDSDISIDDFILNYAIVPREINLPFVGGVLGWIAYDKTLSWHQLPTHHKKIFSHLPDFDIAYYSGAVVVDHLLQKVVLVHQNDSVWANEIYHAWLNGCPKKLEKPSKLNFKPLMSLDTYQQSIEAIQSYIREGRVYQLNFTQGFMSPFAGDEFAWYLQKQQANIPYAAFFKGQNYTLMSLSPECFIRIEGNYAHTYPIKGTIRRGENSEEDAALKNWLIHSEKNQAENIMIVDLLRNDFGKFAKSGSVCVPQFCECKAFPNVFHLISQVSCELPDDMHPFQFAKACMPGGSITGAPKFEAMKLITELELHQRGPYCGHFFYLSQHGRFDSNILIRTVVAHEHELLLQAGGGIVIDSKIDEEYAECFAKIKNLIV